MPRSTFQEFLGLHDLGSVRFYKAVLSEFVATTLLIVMGCGSVVSMDEGRDLPQMTPAFVFGMTVAQIVWTFNHVSGAHINPVVSLAMLVTGQLNLLRVSSYLCSFVLFLFFLFFLFVSFLFFFCSFCSSCYYFRSSCC